MADYQAAKRLIRTYFEELERIPAEKVDEVLERYTSSDYLWRGVYPFREQHGAGAAAEVFWKPLKSALSHMQRRMDVFIAGNNELDGEVWVMCMGQFMGLFD